MPPIFSLSRSLARVSSMSTPSDTRAPSATEKTVKALDSWPRVLIWWWRVRVGGRGQLQFLRRMIRFPEVAHRAYSMATVRKGGRVDLVVRPWPRTSVPTKLKYSAATRAHLKGWHRARMRVPRSRRMRG